MQVLSLKSHFNCICCQRRQCNGWTALSNILEVKRSGRGRDRMIVAFTTIYVISAYHHKRSEFESRSRRGVLDTTLCDKVCQWQFSPVSSTNKTDHHDITEILLKVVFNTTTLTILEVKWDFIITVILAIHIE